MTDLHFYAEIAAHYVTGPDGVIILSALIFAGFVLVLSRFLIASRKVKGYIRSAVHPLAEMSSAQEFAQKFETLNQTLETIPVFGHYWAEFVECLIVPSNSDKQIIQVTRRPEEYFSTASLVESKLNLRFYNAVPNILTGTGILFTFVGLAAGIYLAQDSFSSSDQDQMLEALSSLLGGASLAFWTSIWGLLTSIVFNFAEKKRLHTLQKIVDQLNCKLDECLETVTAEKISHDVLKENRAQRIQLERFNTDLAVSIASALDEKLAARLQPTLESLIESMNGLKAERSTELESFFRDLSGEFKKSLTDSASTEMNELTTSLANLTSSLKQIAADLESAGIGARESLGDASRQFASDIGSLVSENMERLSEQQRKSEESFTSSMSRMSEHLNQIGELLENSIGSLDSSLKQSASDAGRLLSESASGVSSEMKSVASQISTILASMEQRMDSYGGHVSSLGEFTDKLLEATDRLKQTIQDVSNVHDSLKSATVPLSTVSEKLDSTANRLGTSLSQFDQLRVQLAESAEAMRDWNRKIGESWDRIERRYVGLDDSLGQLFQNLQLGIEKYTDQVRDFVGELDRSFSKALQTLSGAVSELNDVLEEIGEKVAPSK